MRSLFKFSLCLSMSLIVCSGLQAAPATRTAASSTQVSAAKTSAEKKTAAKKKPHATASPGSKKTAAAPVTSAQKNTPPQKKNISTFSEKHVSPSARPQYSLASMASLSTSTSLDPFLRSSLLSFINEIETERPALQGVAMAILHKGQVIYKRTFGYQKGQSGPITAQTLFPLGSVSKPVAATALALLVDNGQLELEKSKKLPYFQHPVHLKHILSHTTGYHFSGNQHIEKGWERPKILKALQQEKPACGPGECHFYSNMIYSLIEEMLNTENLNLKTVVTQLSHVLNTEGIQVPPLKPHMSVAYPHRHVQIKKGQTGLKAMPFPPYYPKAAPAAAGIFGSLDGMIELFKLQFGYRPDLISHKTLQQFYAPVTTSPKFIRREISRKHKVRSYYGLGWRILRAEHHPEKDLIFHPGYIGGIGSFLGYFPDQELGIIILNNQDSGALLRKSIDLWAHLLG